MREADEEEVSLPYRSANSIADPDFGARYALKQYSQRLLDRD
jgi:hypothetical protein